MPTESIPPATVVWFRRDLRLSDNPALEAAVARGGPVVAAWVHAPLEEGDSAPGAAARVFLHESLRSLAESLASRGCRLVLRRGPTIKALIDLARETGADAVYANKAWEPPLLARDAKAVAALRANGLDARLFDDDVLFPPDAMKTTAGGPFRVFTPFLRRCLSSPDPEAPRPAPARIPSPATPPPSWPLPELRLLPSVPWDDGIRAAWPAGEKAGRDRLSGFLEGAMAAYPRDRDRPDRDGTSRLSPYLHFGCVSARQVWHAVRSRAGADSAPGAVRGAEAFLRQLVWREFAHHLLFHFPATVHAPLREEFASFPWRDDPSDLVAWQKGRTGYPLVDAGMRQLWKTGWIHNRVRMVGRFVPGQGPSPPVAEGSRLVLRHPGGRGSREQHLRLAVGRRMRRGRRAVSSGSSTRRCRVGSSIPGATMSGRGCPSSPGCRTGGSIGHGMPPRPRCPGRE